MVFPRMYLLQDPTNSGLALSHHNEEILNNEALCGEFIYDLNVSQPLLVCAHFILALHNVYALPAKDPPSLIGRREIKIEDGLMILLLRVTGAIIAIILLEILVTVVGRPSGSMHVRRVKDHHI